MAVTTELQKTYKVKRMTRIKEILIEPEALREENHSLKVDNEFLQKQNTALKIRCSDYCLRNQKLEDEIADMKFTRNYLTSEEAGKAFARELLGKPMTREELAIEAAENSYTPYNGDDF